MSDEAEVRRWLGRVTADPGTFALPQYGPFITPERTAAYFAQWAADEQAGVPSPALCRRCGRVLHARTIIQPGRQLHEACCPRGWPEP